MTRLNSPKVVKFAFKQTISYITGMALQELQPRVKVLEIEALRRPVRSLVEGDQIVRPMIGLVDSFTSGTYPEIQVVVDKIDKVNVTWREASGNFNRTYSLEGPDINRDPVVKKITKWTAK